MCMTPPYAVSPLIPYLKGIIWECAAGENHLANAIANKSDLVVFVSDIERDGRDFFNYEISMWDMIVTNPPFSIKYKWIQRCFELGKPWALLLPLETMGSSTAQDMFVQYGGVEIILFNKRIDYKMPNKGWLGSAQFPSVWITHGLGIGREITYADIAAEKKAFRQMIKDQAQKEAGQMELF